MDQQTKKYSFGRYLWTARQDRGISISQISDETKIAKDIIRLIEEENHALLPDRVFVTGFIRSYTKALGVDGDEVVRLYGLSYENYRCENFKDNDRTGRGMGPGLKLFMALSAFCLIIAGAFFLMENLNRHDGVPVPASFHEEPPPVEDEVKPDPVKSGAVQEDPEKTDEDSRKEEGSAEEDAVQAGLPPENPEPALTEKEPVPEEAPHAKPVSEKMKLKVICTEETWMKIIVDGQDPVEFTMKPDSRQLLEAESNFNILVGNAGGVKIFLDGKPVKVSGKSGQIATIQIP